MMLFSASKKTKVFSVFDKKAPNTRLSKFLKPRSLLIVNNCFKNENAAVGVFLQRLYKINIILKTERAHSAGLMNVSNQNQPLK